MKIGKFDIPSNGDGSHANGDILYFRPDGTVYTPEYPTAFNTTYVKTTSELVGSTYSGYQSCNPGNSLTGAPANAQWLSANANAQRFHIDLGSAKIIKRIYYENSHNSGLDTNRGVKDFILQGSNEASAFAELTYETDTNWVGLTTSQSAFDEHTASDVADPKYIGVTNTTAYRYYAIKCVNGYTGYDLLGLRRIVLQTGVSYIAGWQVLPIGTSGQTLKVSATGYPAWTT